MRLILGVSSDGYLSRETKDRMDWLGPTDKAVFRILTSVGGVCGVSVKTAALMPSSLPGRRMCLISRSLDEGMSLVEFSNRFPGGWLLGGPTLAKAALELDLVSEVHLCRSNRAAFPVQGAVRDTVTDFLKLNSRNESCNTWWSLKLTTPIVDMRVECWKRHKAYEQQRQRD